jgi:shikimate kinase
MKLIFLIGSAAVGKMTVGQELSKITNLHLFHNHMTIEPVMEVFGYYREETIRKLRNVIFEDFANSEHYGMIYTCVWVFDKQSYWEYMEYVEKIFENIGSEIYCVELMSSLEIRLQRNATDNRLKNKKSKRNIAESNQRLVWDDENYRCVSNDGEIPFVNYMRIDNSHLEPDVVAQMIKDKFSL